MASQKIATIEDIDRAFTGVLKAESGPFRMMDRVGLDTMLSINDFWCKRLLQLPKLDPVNRRNRSLLKQYISQGYLGEKSGQGFYEYPDVDKEPVQHCLTGSDKRC
jgi:3-hydroxybutyryl-CoA dehydrogenase